MPLRANVACPQHPGRHGESFHNLLLLQDLRSEPARLLFDEIGQHVAKEPIQFGLFVQLAEPGDDVANASVTWPDHADDQSPERRKIIFDPQPGVDGLDSSGDPLTEVRADVHLLSGRRRRAVFGDVRR